MNGWARLMIAVGGLVYTASHGQSGDALEGTADLAGIADSRSSRTPLVTVSPIYPPRARRDRIEGETTVCFVVDAHGAIRHPRIRESSHRLFRRPSMKAIRGSSFEPAGPGQLPRDRVCRTYRFLLDPVPRTDDGSRMTDHG